jgi:hypothetical protein
MFFAVLTIPPCQQAGSHGFWFACRPVCRKTSVLACWTASVPDRQSCRRGRMLAYQQTCGFSVRPAGSRRTEGARVRPHCEILHLSPIVGGDSVRAPGLVLLPGQIGCGVHARHRRKEEGRAGACQSWCCLGLPGTSQWIWTLPAIKQALRLVVLKAVG